MESSPGQGEPSIAKLNSLLFANHHRIQFGQRYGWSPAGLVTGFAG